LLKSDKSFINTQKMNIQESETPTTFDLFRANYIGQEPRLSGCSPIREENYLDQYAESEANLMDSDEELND
jgi:hypothetical protein